MAHRSGQIGGILVRMVFGPQRNVPGATRSETLAARQYRRTRPDTDGRPNARYAYSLARWLISCFLIISARPTFRQVPDAGARPVRPCRARGPSARGGRGDCVVYGAQQIRPTCRLVSSPIAVLLEIPLIDFWSRTFGSGSPFFFLLLQLTPLSCDAL